VNFLFFQFSLQSEFRLLGEFQLFVAGIAWQKGKLDISSLQKGQSQKFIFHAQHTKILNAII
jgi:hypothetical protein